MKKYYWIFLLGAILAVGYFSWMDKGNVVEEDSDLMPAWEVPDLQGDLLKSEVFKGDVLLVNFWVTWCPVCQKEQPFLNDLQAKYADKGLKIIGVSLDENTAGEVAAIVKQRGITYLQAMGTGTNISELFGGITSVPASFFVNRQGEIVRSHYGTLPHEEAETLINSLL